MSCGQVPRHRSRACLRLQQILRTASARPLRFHLPPSLPLSLPVYSPPLSPYLLPTFLPVSSPFPSHSLSHSLPSYPLSYLNIRHFSPPRILCCSLAPQDKMHLLVLDLRTEEMPLTSMFLYRITSSQFYGAKTLASCSIAVYNYVHVLRAHKFLVSYIIQQFYEYHVPCLWCGYAYL